MNWFTRRINRIQRRKSSTRHAAFNLRLEMMEDRDVPTVLDYGGALLPHVEAQALFLGSEWSAVSTDAAQTHTLNSYLSDLTGGAYVDALSNAGYGVGRGTASPGAVDKTAYGVGTTITDASIQARIQTDVKNGLLQAPDANRLYVVYVEPNVAVNLGAGQGTTRQGILGYHGAFAGHDASGKPVTIHYAVVAYPGGTAHNSSMGVAPIDQLTAVASHELAEAVTDPNVNYAQLGWYDPRRGEIGDITENNPNALVRLDGYLVQEVADQNDQLLTLNIPAPPAPASPPSSGPVASSTTLMAGPVGTNPFGIPTVVLTITISPGSGSAAPSGLVALIYDGRVLGVARVHVVNGVATASFNVEFFGSGDFTFSALFIPFGAYQASSSNSISVSV